VAAYVHRSLLSHFWVLPRFKGVDNVLALDDSSNQALLGTKFHSFGLVNASTTNSRYHGVHSVLPDTLFLDLGVPLLVLGDLNIHNPLSDPLRSFPPPESVASTPCFEKVAQAGFALLNPPVEYSRFSLVGNACHPL